MTLTPNDIQNLLTLIDFHDDWDELETLDEDKFADALITLHN